MITYDFHTLSADAIQEFRDWDFSFTGIFEYLGDLAVHHVYEQGIWGVIAIIFIVLAILIAYPPTRYLGSQLSSNLIQSVFSVLNLAVLGTGLLILAATSRVGQGAVRNFGRSMVDWAKKKK